MFIKKSIIILICLGLMFSQTALGQEDVAAPGGPRQQLATIVFAGLAGAILGLSTLSFYGRPQDKLSNIAVGFALGIISGTVYTTYKTATQYEDPYKDVYLLPNEEFRLAHDDRFDLQLKEVPLNLSYQWSF